MRPVLVTDITTAARALLAAQPVERMELAVSILQDADFGDRYRRRFGRVHALFGDGTLSAAARKRVLVDEPTFDDVAFCECVELVVQQLLLRRISLDR